MVVAKRRIKRTRKGDFELRLPEEERTVLRSLAAQMREILTEDLDPGLRRLYPTAYADDRELDEEYHRLVHDDLLARRLAALEVVEATVDSERVDQEQLVAWMGAINDTPARDRHEARRLGGPVVRHRRRRPAAPAYAIYTYLGWLLEQVVEELNP